MNKFKLLLAAGAASLMTGCGLGAPDYPTFSEASYRIEGTAADPNGGPATQTVIYRNGPQMRVEATIPQYGPAVVVFDQSTNAAYVLTSTVPATGAAPAAVVQPAPAAPVAGAPAAAPAPTRTISGVAVRLADADAPQPMETAWAALGEDNARSVGGCNVAGEEGHEWTPREQTAGVERIACITSDGIVLRVTENGAVLWEATSVQRGQQDASMFGVPAGYQLIDPQAVAEGVSESMEQLDSVTGAPPAPQRAPDPRG